jgi:hypothetical protein
LESLLYHAKSSRRQQMLPLGGSGESMLEPRPRIKGPCP